MWILILSIVAGLFLVFLFFFTIRTRQSFLKNKVVLITGGSRGLGLVIARQICVEYGKVALVARDADELARAEADLAGRGGEVMTISCDLLERAQIEAAVQETIKRYGKIDILINNANFPNLFAHAMKIMNAYLPSAVGPSGSDSRVGSDFP
jgi:NAD(P)-dependent dehydrogenase (short-subunit alcohol dehydrogenase family)